MKAYLGIDPGISGGLTLLYGNDLSAHKMPESDKDLWDLVEMLGNWEGWEVVAALEQVHSMPGQGVSSSFTFGRGYGRLRMALVGCSVPFVDVTPQKWQKSLQCLTGGKKNVSKSRAQQLYPKVKWTHATADSALIATWLKQSNAI